MLMPHFTDSACVTWEYIVLQRIRCVTATCTVSALLRLIITLVSKPIAGLQLLGCSVLSKLWNFHFSSALFRLYSSHSTAASRTKQAEPACPEISFAFKFPHSHASEATCCICLVKIVIVLVVHRNFLLMTCLYIGAVAKRSSLEGCKPL